MIREEKSRAGGKKMIRIVIILGVSVLLVFADGPVLKTGQKKSYDGVGNIVTNGSVKDDGYYRAGKARSYSRSGDIVIDNATGLHWQDNESIQKKWTEASGDTAAAYCGNLLLYYNNAYYYDWQLPSIEELRTLPDASQYSPSATQGIFNHIQSYDYWSSTIYANNTFQAWYVTFYDAYLSYNFKSSGNYVRCVRGGQLKPSNLSRNMMTGIVTDSTTGLQWQDDSAVGTTGRDWIASIDYCEDALALGGYTDWRIPNKNELLSIVDYSRINPSITTSVFNNTSSYYYWSSTTSANSTSEAWVVDFDYGFSGYATKSIGYHVRCVRGGQFDINPSIIMYLLD